jgi:hypothetical protein
MAWVSLLLLGMPFVAGCFDSPPQYSEPDRVPPVIDADVVDPAVTKIYVPDGDVASFEVAFRADDAGQKIEVCFVRDIGQVTRALVDSKQAPPDKRPFSEQVDPRTVPLTWPWKTDGTPAGCHTVTAVVADQNDIIGKCDVPSSRPSARITWFVWLHDATMVPDSSNDTKFPGIDCFSDKSSGVTGQ